MDLDRFKINEKITLPPLGTWPESAHVFEEKCAYAVNAAIAAARPLLVRGEPGTGKSQLARAAAHVLKRLFISVVVNARSEGQDLQYHFDTIARLGEAQALGACGGGENVKRILDPLNYLSPGPLWWAFDWESAKRQFERCEHNVRRPWAPEEWTPEKGCVLLIDEIDKADADLPNSLLETLGNGAFSVPYHDETIGVVDGMAAPLVVISTNEERELPGAFVRRCMVLQMEVPDKEEEFVQWLMERGRHHFGERCGKEVRMVAAKQLWGDRQEADRQGVTPPGQAEYLDMLRAVGAMAEGEEAQLDVLAKIKDFALRKHGAKR